MRSEVDIPKDFQLLPQLLRQTGYYCVNHKKEDYNLKLDAPIWDQSDLQAHWRNRGANQPFFAVFNIETSHESQIRKRPHKQIHDPGEVKLPGYHPDLPEIRQDWAQYYDQVSLMDAGVGKILAELKDDGLDDSTIVFYFGDHGSGMPRGKRWLYQSGLSVPLIVHVPEKYRALANAEVEKFTSTASVSDELVSFIDLAPTMLSLAGCPILESMQGRAFAGPEVKPAPQYCFGFRDRMDERIDCSRCVRDKNFLYIRNFMPHRPQAQFLDYMYETPTTTAWLSAFKRGETNPAQSRFWQLKDYEELYDLNADPDQLNNIANDVAHAKKKHELKQVLKEHIVHSRDLALMPESVVQRYLHEDPATYPTPWHIAQDNDVYPIESLWNIADAAIDLTQDFEAVTNVKASKTELAQYWIVTGAMYRGLKGQLIQPAMLKTYAESSQTDVVGIVANEAIARMGDKEERAVALKQLSAIALDKQSSYYTRWQALDSALSSNVSLQELDVFPTTLSEIMTDIPKRYRAYGARLLKALGRLAAEPELILPLKELSH